MATEDDHLAQLRGALEGLQAEGGDPAVRRAVEVLLKVAIAHHESPAVGIPAEATPAFMETGEPIDAAALDAPPASEPAR